MAIIKCPECDNEISDSAKKCIHCGFKFKDNSLNNKMIEKIIIGVVITIIVIGLAVGIILLVNKNKEEKRQRDLEIAEQKRIAEEKQREKDYISDYRILVYKILSASAETENCGNLVKSVWYNTIWEKSDPETDIYTQSNGVFYDDFNDALGVLFASDTYLDYYNNIKDSKTDISKLMMKMKNPPEKYADAYEALKNFYDEFLIFSNSCTNPSGNYNSYSSNFINGDTNTMNAYSKLEPYLGD